MIRVCRTALFVIFLTHRFPLKPGLLGVANAAIVVCFGDLLNSSEVLKVTVQHARRHIPSGDFPGWILDNNEGVNPDRRICGHI